MPTRICFLMNYIQKILISGLTGECTAKKAGNVNFDFLNDLDCT
jgi:hypothetical protein